jgi:hypothetical protein
MKKTLIITALGIFLISLSHGQSEWSDAWEFDDEPGTTIDQAANTGYFGKLQFDQVDPPTGGRVFGGGRFMVAEPGSWSNRKVDMTGYKGIITIELSIHSWELDSKDTVEFLNFRQFGFRLRSNEYQETPFVLMIHQMKLGNLKLRNVTTSFGQNDLLADEAQLPMVNYNLPFVLRVEVDTDFGDYSVFVNGELLANGGEAALTAVDQFQLFSQGGISGSELNSTPFLDDYIIYDSLRINATVLPGSTWAGYEIGPQGWVDTGEWIGWVNVTNGVWVWALSLGKYIYLPEGNVTASGAWMYFLAGSTTPPGGDNTWAGYEIVADGWVDTDDFIGWVNITRDPWIWSEPMGMYLYLQESSVGPSGSWSYAPGI